MVQRYWPVIVAFCGALVLLAGCAAIPEESPAKGLPGGGSVAATSSVAQPEHNADPLTLVRDFIAADANPDGEYVAAKQYLTPSAKNTWSTAAPLTIIQDVFSTRYQSDNSDDAKATKRTVLLQAQSVGRLGGDKSFVPESDSAELSIDVEKQSDGQWRISKPPNGVLVAVSKFNDYYRQVRVYFLDPGRRVLVPDLRYVAATPSAGVPARVVDQLLSGPSDGMREILTSALGPNATLRADVAETDDGALLVNLTQPGDLSQDNRKLIVAQIVQSLQAVTNSRIRLEVDGVALTPHRLDWQASDLPAYDIGTSPSPDLPGLLVTNGQVRSLGDGKPVAGPEGTGDYQVRSAAQSIDGTEIAAVGGVGAAQLRVGKLGQPLSLVGMNATTLTRPTWQSTDTDSEVATEVWTVADGVKVVRVVSSVNAGSVNGGLVNGGLANGNWIAKPVDASDLNQFGSITEFRLSRDGVRFAAVVGGHLIIGAVVRSVPDTVALRAPRLLQPTTLTNVVGVDWLTQDQLAVATATETTPVAQVSVDGFSLDRYNTANLTAPIKAVTAAPSRAVVVVDSGGMWTASDISAVWHPHQITVGRNSDAVPCYPG